MEDLNDMIRIDTAETRSKSCQIVFSGSFGFIDRPASEWAITVFDAVLACNLVQRLLFYYPIASQGFTIVSRAGCFYGRTSAFCSHFIDQQITRGSTMTAQENQTGPPINMKSGWHSVASVHWRGKIPAYREIGNRLACGELIADAQRMR